MKTLAGLLGSGAGLVVAGLAWVAMQHYRNLPSALHKWIQRALIAVMFIAGSALAVTTLGGWILAGVAWVANLFGGTGNGTAHAVITIAALSLLVTVVVGIVWVPDDAVAATALFLPLALALPAGGVLHQVYVSATVPAQVAASQISAWLGG